MRLTALAERCRAPEQPSDRVALRRKAITPSEGMTYEEIGAVMGLTRSRIQQIEREALAKLRSRPGALEAIRMMLAEEREPDPCVPFVQFVIHGGGV